MICLSVVVGGLLSAHLLSRRAGLQLDPGWPCSGPLLQLAEIVARKLLPGMGFTPGVVVHYGIVPVSLNDVMHFGVQGCVSLSSA
jgi:hypothetical protein